MIGKRATTTASQTMISIKNSRILVVEDHRDLAETIIDFLETMGAIVDYASDGFTGLHLACTQKFDVIVLDINLPGMDGIELCSQLRNHHEGFAPVLMVTALDELNDKLRGFQAGADDYLIKPFELPELVARAHALVRRQRPSAAVRTLEVADLVHDSATGVVTRQGRILTLTPAGHQILRLLMINAPNIVSREDIEMALWGDSPPASDTLRSQIYKLRQQVDKPFDMPLIHTSKRSGYRLIVP